MLDSPKVTTSGWVGGSRSTVALMHVEVASTSRVVNRGMEGERTSWGHDWASLVSRLAVITSSCEWLTSVTLLVLTNTCQISWQGLAQVVFAESDPYCWCRFWEDEHLTDCLLLELAQLQLQWEVCDPARWSGQRAPGIEAHLFHLFHFTESRLRLAVKVFLSFSPFYKQGLEYQTLSRHWGKQWT